MYLNKPSGNIGAADDWHAAFENRRFRNVFMVSVILLAVVLFLLAAFLEYAESRDGTTIRDPILGFFTAIDFTWLIFAVIYASLFTAIISLVPHPPDLLFAVQLYMLMVISRIAAMYLLPLEPPQGMIVLQDPFIGFFGVESGLTKDLFFSGHTASILIFYFTARNRMLKTFFLVLTIIIAVLVILQKVHYTVDIYAAVFFTTASYFFLKKIKVKYNI